MRPSDFTSRRLRRERDRKRIKPSEEEYEEDAFALDDYEGIQKHIASFFDLEAEVDNRRVAEKRGRSSSSSPVSKKKTSPKVTRKTPEKAAGGQSRVTEKHVIDLESENIVPATAAVEPRAFNQHGVKFSSFYKNTSAGPLASSTPITGTVLSPSQRIPTSIPFSSANVLSTPPKKMSFMQEPSSAAIMKSSTPSKSVVVEEETNQSIRNEPIEEVEDMESEPERHIVPPLVLSPNISPVEEAPEATTQAQSVSSSEAEEVSDEDDVQDERELEEEGSQVEKESGRGGAKIRGKGRGRGGRGRGRGKGRGRGAASIGKAVRGGVRGGARVGVRGAAKGAKKRAVAEDDGDNDSAEELADKTSSEKPVRRSGRAVKKARKSSE
jgi:hypothetical protein